MELLEWEPSMGYGELCKFLNKPVPDEEFPWVNDTATLRAVMAFLVVRGCLTWTAAVGLPLAAAYAWKKFFD